MNHPETNAAEYSGQVARWVAAFAAGRYQEFEGALEETCTPNDVRRFLVNSFGNRYAWLIRETAPLAPAFDDLEDRIQTYIRTVPRAPFGITAPMDEERFLTWLAEMPALTPLQRDYVTCQRGEYAVGTEARRNRVAHVRFQALWKHADERAARFGTDASLRIHLNPIHFTGELLTSVFAPGAASLPIPVIFHAAGTSVRAGVLEEAMVEPVGELARRGPCTLAEWCEGMDAERRDELRRLAGELAAQGLAAFE